MQLQELKGYNTTFATKKYFYEQILMAGLDAQEFEIYSIIVDKRKLPVKVLHDLEGNHRLYNILAKNVLELIDFSDFRVGN
ncbi:MAG: hypothetical protein EXR81_05990 [Gammaproteobacteria bacterium]|nr:hypothetical protein [Gammaproteobacteria bacterium]